MPERALPEDVEDQVSISDCELAYLAVAGSKQSHILVPIFLVTQYIIDIEYVIAIFVVEAIILHPFAWLREDTSWIPR